MDKTLVLKITNFNDSFDETYAQDLFGVTKEGEQITFSCCDLYECPEDATLSRNIFDAYQFVEAIELGMSLAKQGYEDIDLEVEEEKSR